jgi:DNA polymerase-1
MKIPCYETRVYEADDVIASYADALRAGMDIVICSHDSDFFQLIGPGVSVLRYRGEKSVLCDEVWLMEKYGITGSMYADFKCLTGDSADNIRGLDGVGPKRASLLINRFGSLDGLVSGYASIERERLRGIVAAGQETLALNRSLIYMKRDIELPVAAQELGFEENGMGTMDILRALEILP